MTINKAFYSYMLLACYALYFSSCHPKLAPGHSVVNREVRNAQGTPNLLGVCTRDRLQQAPYSDWFVKNYQDYHVDSATADRLKTSLAGHRLRIFMGTWCGDSRREVPRMFRILDY